ncbi:hypothetical protein BK344_24920 [Escherichia coli]|nr:hypothetical protein BK344_24920 [Escherichia coli]OJP57765.1 hypothetical protein BK345_24920 [Escherichia coli]
MECRIMSTMNVLICQQPKELVWKQREIPIPGDNEALIKIKSVISSVNVFHMLSLSPVLPVGGVLTSKS